MESMKIVFTNYWHDSNKGDSGIVMGQLGRLREKFPEAVFAVVSSFTKADPRFESSTRHLRNEFPDLEVLESPFMRFDRSSQEQGIWKKGSAAVGMAAAILKAIGGYYTHPTLRRVIEADLTIDRGGHLFHCSGSAGSTLGFVSRTAFMVLRHRINRPHIVYGSSVGPIRGSFARRWAKYAFSKSSLLSVRESLSRSELMDLGVENEVHIVPDGAFFLEPDFSRRVRSLTDWQEGNALIVVPRNPAIGLSSAARDRVCREYLDRLARGIREFLSTQREPVEVRIVPQCDGPLEIEDDRFIAYELAKMLPAERTAVIDHDFSPRELVALYSRARVVVGTRFHSVIFSLISGTPAIALSYFGPKAEGIMELLDQSRFVLNAHDFLPTELSSHIGLMWTNRDKFRNQIFRKLEQLRRLDEDFLLDVSRIVGRVTSRSDNLESRDSTRSRNLHT